MSGKVAFPPSIWAATAPERVTAPHLKTDIETDTVVIGGGFSGLSAALHLAREGGNVVVLEGEAVGWGASGRNNGQVIPTLTSAEPDAWVGRYGETGRRFAEMIGQSAATVFDIIRREGINAEAEQAGWFQPAHSPGRVKLMQKRAEAWTRFGLDIEVLDRAQTTDLLGSDFWYGGILAPSGGHINPLALARGLARAVEHHGGTIYEQSPVQRFERVGSEWVVMTHHGRVRARSLILATNTYTGELVPKLASKLARSVVPVLSWQMSTPPVSDNLRAKILPGRQAVSDTRGDLRFFRYDARNRLITGGAVMGSWKVEERVRAKAARNLAEAFPELGVPEMTHVWSGYIGMNWDRFPRVHSLGPNGWAWMGFNGRGVALGVALGREVARAVAGEDPRGLALPVTEPHPFPLHSVVRRFAPTYLAWLRRKDLVDPKL
ncbi:NAD(P)/FAD-dependent oxidoreductase [Antarcticimicrobium sediminis]|uniref:FAD-binding oxidoreductase n=1 Tax=Antarcticimicrobium sediminis TaxID=2546227 RepID=A0A4R5ET92_9RHOB|nr:FAD-binding oxidoreductase [Antarcticimicrobium sediminis]TDE37912.1 FAD-binding oxidoreductase [Antarcticimicrobium sediminis]